MGRNLPHSGAGDGKKVFKTEMNMEKFSALKKELAAENGVPIYFSKNKPKSKEKIKDIDFSGLVAQNPGAS